MTLEGFLVDSGILSQLTSLSAYLANILQLLIVARWRRGPAGQWHSGVDGPLQGRRYLFGSVSFDRPLSRSNLFLVLVSVLVLGSWAGEAWAQDTVAPTVRAVEIVSEPQKGDTYIYTSRIVVEVTFSEEVTLVGESPQLALTVGSEKRQASYAYWLDNDNKSSIKFSYEVQKTDRDMDGISIDADALSLNGGSIKDGAGNEADLNLRSHTIVNDPQSKVDGSRYPIPRVLLVEFSTEPSHPPGYDTYILGNTISVMVEFGWRVEVTGSPRLALTIGSERRLAFYMGRRGGRLQFDYKVQATDLDTDGFHIEADALLLNGGSIRNLSGDDVELSLGGIVVPNEVVPHKVDGSKDPPPRISRLAFATNPQVGNTYFLGETIQVSAGFNEPVTATGSPQLALTIGTERRLATFSYESAHALYFTYEVQATDLDADGIGIEADSLSLNGGSIRDGTGNHAELSHDARIDDSSHKVDGSKVDGSQDETIAPTVQLRFITSYPAPDHPYLLGDMIEVLIQFSENVWVTGNPQIALTIGSETRQAAYHGKSGGERLYFHYEVQAGDLDTDGISIGVDALSLNGGSIRDAAGNDAELSLGDRAINDDFRHTVDGSQQDDSAPMVTDVWISPRSPPGDTRFVGELVEVLVLFSDWVRVRGNPQLALTIGSATRQAAYQYTLGKRLLHFRYEVQAGDLDADGISVGAGALSPNGGSIRNYASKVAELSLGSHAIVDDSNHKVDGSVDPAPNVRGVMVLKGLQEQRDLQEQLDKLVPCAAYVWGTEVEVGVLFSKPVTVTGSPQLALTIGQERRQAAYSRSRGSWLYFTYEVQEADKEADRLSIGANALSLNGGSIQDADGVAAELSSSTHTIANYPIFKGYGGCDLAPAVGSLDLGTDPRNPRSGRTYVLGEEIEVSVDFSEAVIVTGTPRLALTIGSEKRQAFLMGGGDGLTRSLRFRYRVEATDLDTDGFTIEANALTLDGGSIRDLSGNDAFIFLRRGLTANAVGQKVDGRTDPPPTVYRAAIIHSPQMGNTYILGETVVAWIGFSESVEVVGRPQLALTIGSERRQATFVGTIPGRVFFNYQIQATDRDMNGISIEADALSLNGGSIRDRTGNDAEFRWSSDRFADDYRHQVDGGFEDTIAPKIQHVRLFQGSRGFGSYLFGETIRVWVRFNEKVEVTGKPQLALMIGSETRQATYVYSSKTGRGVLYFEYQVQASDFDSDGISVGADGLSLNGGSIQDAAGNDAELSIGDDAVVDGQSKVEGGRRDDFPPTVTDAWITARSPRGDTHVLGDIVEVQVLFSERVRASGKPQLALTVGSATRQAAYEYTHWGNRLVHTRYQVQAGDFDSDGISLGMNALNLNGGSIQDAVGNDAELSLDSHAIVDDLDHKVDGSVDLAPSVRSVMILTDPKEGATPDTHNFGEKAVVGILFSEGVMVAGNPQLILKVGSERRRATYERSSGNWLYFSYRMKGTDLDADGISVTADALTLNGGSIRDAAGNDAELSLGNHAIADDAGHKVDGSEIGIPRGDWTPDHQSGASIAVMEGKATITFRHGGRIEEDGLTYTCLSSGGCKIDGRRITMGAFMVSDTASESELMVAGVAEFVDDRTEFQEKIYNGYELKESTVTFRSVAGETTRVSFLDLDGDLVFVDFSSDDPATEMVITLEEFSGTLEESPFDQPDTRYARGLATVTLLDPTELTWLRVVSLGNHIDRVDLALIEDDTFAGEVDGIADIKAVVIEGEGSIGVIDAANANFMGSSGEIGIDAAETIVKRALSIGDITPSEGTTPVLRVSAESLDPANAADGETVIAELQIAGGDLREATGALQIDTGGIVYDFPIVAVDGERSIRNSELRPDLGDGILEAVTDTFVADPDDYFVTRDMKTGVADSTE